MFKIIEVESASKFSLRVLWKMVLFMVCNFQNGVKYQTFRNVSIYFPLSYHNNVMLKTDIMLDFEPHSFSNFLIFSSQGDNDDGHEGGGVAEDAGGKEEKG